MVEAGFKRVFFGIETPAPESLAEMREEREHRARHGGGGAGDSAGGDRGDGGFHYRVRQRPTGRFLNGRSGSSRRPGIVTAMVGLLNALPKTRLFTRLSNEGRILRGTTGNNLDSVLNFIPTLDREVLVERYRELVRDLYAPKAYYKRVRTFLGRYRKRGPRVGRSRSDVRAFLKSLWVLGVRSRGRRAYWTFFLRTLLLRPRKFGEAMYLAILGHHFRMIAQGMPGGVTAGGCGGEAASPLVKLEHALLSWNAIAIMPIFALANAGVAEGGEASGV